MLPKIYAIDKPIFCMACFMLSDIIIIELIDIEDKGTGFYSEFYTICNAYSNKLPFKYHISILSTEPLFRDICELRYLKDNLNF